jgi:membrane-associated phospholipid phosphatase
MKFFANLISWIFLPLLMPIYALLLAMFVPSMENGFYQEKTMYWMDIRLKLAVLGLYLIFSFVAPAISLIFLKRANIISNLEVDNRTERSIPILTTALYCALLACFLYSKAYGAVPNSIILLPTGGLIAILIAGVINFVDKISMHALGVGMYVGFLVAYYQYQVQFAFSIIIVSVLIAGLVMSARIYLGKHTLVQSLSGFFLGFFVQFILLTYFGG